MRHQQVAEGIRVRQNSKADSSLKEACHGQEGVTTRNHAEPRHRVLDRPPCSCGRETQVGRFTQGRAADPDDLATAADVQPLALYRLLRALASVGVFAESKGPTIQAHTTRRHTSDWRPGSMHGWALMINENWGWDAWKELAPWSEDGRGAVSQKAHRVPISTISRNTPRTLRSLANQCPAFPGPKTLQSQPRISFPGFGRW